MGFKDALGLGGGGFCTLTFDVGRAEGPQGDRFGHICISLKVGQRSIAVKSVIA